MDIGIEKTEIRTCDGCGVEFEAAPHEEKRFCELECSYGNRKHDNYHTADCEICGKEYKTGGPVKAKRRRTCGRDCFSKLLSKEYSGENHPSWKGGRPDYYGTRWNKQRQKALERDNYECVICGKGKDELGIHPDVHHIVPVADFEDKDNAHDLINLVTLCRKHHDHWEGLYLRPDTR
jgi:hypothetical protein